MSLADIGQDVGMLDHGIRFLQETGQSLMFAEQTGGNTSCKLLYFCFKSSKIHIIIMFFIFPINLILLYQAKSLL